LDAAEQALTRAAARQAKERAELMRRRAALERELGRLEKDHAAEHAKLRRAIERAQNVYEQAIRAWQG
jgi:hypothetical protein